MECWYYFNLMVLLCSWASWFFRRVFGLGLCSVGHRGIGSADWMLQYLQSIMGDIVRFSTFNLPTWWTHTECLLLSCWLAIVACVCLCCLGAGRRIWYVYVFLSNWSCVFARNQSRHANQLGTAWIRVRVFLLYMKHADMTKAGWLGMLMCFIFTYSYMSWLAFLINRSFCTNHSCM